MNNICLINHSLLRHEIIRLQQLREELPNKRYEKLIIAFDEKKDRKNFRIFTHNWKERQLLHVLGDQAGLFSRKELTTVTLDDMHVFCRKCWVFHELDPRYTEDVYKYDPMFYFLKAKRRPNANCLKPFSRLSPGLCCMLHNGCCPKCKCLSDTCEATGTVSVFIGYVEFSRTKLKLGRKKRRRKNRWKRGSCIQYDTNVFGQHV